MIGTDIAVFVARVIGQQVRIGVASRSGTKVLCEETYRQVVAERLSEGPQTFQPLYRAKVNGKTAFYTLTPIDRLECELIESVDQLTSEDDPLAVIRFATKPEAEAFQMCAANFCSNCTVRVEEDNRVWFCIMQFPERTTADGTERKPLVFIDKSLPWEELMKKQ